MRKSVAVGGVPNGGKASLGGRTRDEVLLAISDGADRALIDLTGDAPAPARFKDCPRAA